jgi:hypothetical protein
MGREEGKREGERGRGVSIHCPLSLLADSNHGCFRSFCCGLMTTTVMVVMMMIMAERSVG